MSEEITKEEKKILYSDVEKKMGRERQLWQVFEELGELMTAMNKYIIRCKISEMELADEIADVMIMLEQVVQMFHLDGIVDERKMYKLRRLRERLDDGSLR